MKSANSQLSRWGHLVEPGISLWQQGIERHEIASRTVQFLQVWEGDTLDVLEVERGQVCDLIFVDDQGRLSEHGLLDHASSAKRMPVDFNDYFDLLERGARSNLKGQLERFPALCAQAQCVRLFEEQSALGQHHSLSVRGNGTVIAVAPAHEMDDEGLNAPSTIEILLKRQNPQERV